MALLRFLLALLVALVSAAPITDATSTTVDGRLASLEAKVAKLAVSGANVEKKISQADLCGIPALGGLLSSIFAGSSC